MVLQIDSLGKGINMQNLVQEYWYIVAGFVVVFSSIIYSYLYKRKIPKQPIDETNTIPPITVIEEIKQTPAPQPVKQPLQPTTVKPIETIPTVKVSTLNKPIPTKAEPVIIQPKLSELIDYRFKINKPETVIIQHTPVNKQSEQKNVIQKVEIVQLTPIKESAKPKKIGYIPTTYFEQKEPLSYPIVVMPKQKAIF